MTDLSLPPSEASRILNSLASRMSTFRSLAAVYIHPDAYEAIRAYSPLSVRELSGARYVLGVPAVLAPFVPITTPLIVEGPDAPPAPFGALIRESELDKLHRVLRDYGRLWVDGPAALRYTVRLTSHTPYRYLADVVYALPSTDIACLREEDAAHGCPVLTFIVTGDTARAWFSEMGGKSKEVPHD